MRLTALFSQVMGEAALISIQNPLRLSASSEPEPDLMLLSPREDFYASEHPGPEDVLLLIEVAQSSYPFDKQVKLPLYAEAGIREVWIVNLNVNVLEVFKHPSERDYGYSQVFTAADSYYLESLDLDIPVGSCMAA